MGIIKEAGKFGVMQFGISQYQIHNSSFFLELRGLVPKSLQNVAKGGMAPRPMVLTTNHL